MELSVLWVMCQIQTGLFAEILCFPSLFVLNLTCAIVGRFGEGDPTSGQTIASFAICKKNVFR
jgi:hypothetical protein